MTMTEEVEIKVCERSPGTDNIEWLTEATVGPEAPMCDKKSDYIAAISFLRFALRLEIGFLLKRII